MNKLHFTYKHLPKNAFALILVFILASCSGNVTEEKVRKTALRSQEINNKYMQDIEKKYTKMLEKRIKIISKDIEKLQGVSEDGIEKAGTDINSSLDKLITEKADLENRLKALQFKSTQAKRALDAGFNEYNHELDSVLRDLNTFLTSYKIDAEADKSNR